MIKKQYPIYILLILVVLILTFLLLETLKIEKIPDFSKITNTTERKKAFIAYILPYIKKEITEINNNRTKVLDLYDEYIDGKDISAKDKKWLIRLTFKYKIKNSDVSNFMTLSELQKRLDIIPASMIIAQAALESAWGTSRFAKEGNNLFGQQCYKKGCGIEPLNRDNGKIHEVMKFKNISQSIKAYMLNLNTHKAYEMFRTTRRTNRFKNMSVVKNKLHKKLGKYSEIGNEYNLIIEKIILQNNLEQYDKVNPL